MTRRSGLGKGLGALIPAEAVGERGSALREVPISSVRPNTLQPRTHFDEEAMATLSASIRELGVLQPILVRQDDEGDEYELIAGERRWRAAKRAGLQTIPVIVQNVTDVNSLEHALVENLHREDLSPLEEAAAYQQLVDQFDYTHDQVAARVGRSRTTVTNTLRLLQAPAGVQRALADGELSAGHARALLGTPDRSLQERLAKQVVAENLSVRALEELVRRSMLVAEEEGRAEGEELEEPAGSGAVAGAEDALAPGPVSARGITRGRLPAPGLLELEELLGGYLNTRVKVELTARRGRVTVDFATLEDLERIYKLMVGGA